MKIKLTIKKNSLKTQPSIMLLFGIKQIFIFCVLTVSLFISGFFAKFSDLNIFLGSQTISILRKVLQSFLFGSDRSQRRGNDGSVCVCAALYAFSLTKSLTWSSKL